MIKISARMANKLSEKAKRKNLKLTIKNIRSDIIFISKKYCRKQTVGMVDHIIKEEINEYFQKLGYSVTWKEDDDNHSEEYSWDHYIISWDEKGCV